MDSGVPKAPDEPEVKNIIDKLANFVARNGLEFENMTKSKQRNNPKFSFLFGGQHFGYYRYKLASEQQVVSMQRMNMNNQPGGPDQMVQQSLQNAPWQQQGGFPPYQGGPRPSQMPPRPPAAMHSAPWQQHRPPHFPQHNIGGPRHQSPSQPPRNVTPHDPEIEKLEQD
uniref:SURP motif domain-containing protein n=1 Tax=Ciona savignyi TaxID=51511 RepID=H2YFS5_CIOSA